MNTTVLTPVLARPLHEDPRIHARRWFLLAMMCLSLVLVVMSVSGPRHRDPDDAGSARGVGIADRMDPRRVRHRVRRLAAHGGRARRPIRPQARAARRARGVRGGALVAGLASGAGQVIAGRAVMGIGAALVMPATLVDHHDHLPAGGAEPRDRCVGGLRRRRWRHRSDRLRRPARALLVGIRRAGEPAARRGDVHRDLDLRARVSRRVADAARPSRRRAVARRARCARVHDHPRRRERLDDHTGGRRRRGRGRHAHGVHPVGAPEPASDASSRLLPRSPVQRRQRGRDRRVLRDVRLLLPDDAVPAVRARSTRPWKPASLCCRFRSCSSRCRPEALCSPPASAPVVSWRSDW